MLKALVHYTERLQELKIRNWRLQKRTDVRHLVILRILCPRSSFGLLYATVFTILLHPFFFSVWWTWHWCSCSASCVDVTAKAWKVHLGMFSSLKLSESVSPKKYRNTHNLHLGLVREDLSACTSAIMIGSQTVQMGLHKHSTVAGDIRMKYDLCAQFEVACHWDLHRSQSTRLYLHENLHSKWSMCREPVACLTCPSTSRTLHGASIKWTACFCCVRVSTSTCSRKIMCSQ